MTTTKTSGLGDNLYVAGYDLSGDIQSVKLAAPMKTIDVTGINKSAHERIGGLRDATASFVVYFNPSTSPAQEHVVFSPLPTTDEVFTYARGTALGNPGACINAKQINYDPTRANDGSILFAVDAQANGFGMEWGVQLTAGLRTDTAATNGASVDGGASSAFGAQAYLQVTAFTGTDVTVVLQDSADNSSFSNIASGSFAQTTAAHTTQRLVLSNTATVRRYVRAITTTVGGFTSVTFNVVFNRNQIAGQAF